MKQSITAAPQRPLYTDSRGVVRRRKNVDPEIPRAVFRDGLVGRPTYCPRCGQVLQYEPAVAYCRWGCTRMWPLLGGDIAEQREHERKSGLMAPLPYSLGSRGVHKNPGPTA